MINRSNRFQGWISTGLVVLFTFLLLGWTIQPRSAPGLALGASRSSIPVVIQTSSAQDFATGDVESGRDLFMGRVHFQHEGPPCMGCHNIGQNGLLGGGAMGPDLTDVSTRRSDEEIVGLLSNTGEVISPVMQPIYADSPLTTQEKADLLAFMKASVGQPESNKEGLVFGISLAGFATAVLLIAVIYRNRLRGVRKSLLQKARLETR